MPTSICNRCPAVGKAIAEAKKNKAATPKTKDVAAKIEKALDGHERCAVRHHRRCHTWLEGSHDIAWHQRARLGRIPEAQAQPDHNVHLGALTQGCRTSSFGPKRTTRQRSRDRGQTKCDHRSRNCW